MFVLEVILFILLFILIAPVLHIMCILILDIIITKFNNIRFNYRNFIYLCLVFTLRVFFCMYIYSFLAQILHLFSFKTPILLGKKIIKV
jgi:hypothetical protein